MTSDSFLTMLGTFFGFAAALFFIWGAAEMKARHIDDFASPRYDDNPGLKEYLIRLKADCLCGGFALVLSFLCQVFGAAGETFALLEQSSTGAGVMVALALTLLLTALLAGYRHLTVKRLRREVSAL